MRGVKDGTVQKPLAVGQKVKGSLAKGSRFELQGREGKVLEAPNNGTYKVEFPADSKALYYKEGIILWLCRWEINPA